MATVTFDSSRMRVIRVDPRGGMQATNATTSGVVRIAGAAPSGFPNGELAQIVFKTAGRTLARISLELSEVHALSGASLLGESAATGWPAGADVVTRPVIDSISPRTGALDHERVTDITIYGRGFAARGNLVLFGAAKVPGLMSEAGGTLIRFSAPSLQMKDGKIPIRVWHDGVESNVVNFAVRDEGP